MSDKREAWSHPPGWVPSVVGGVPVGELLTGDELTLTFDLPEFDPPTTVGYAQSLGSGIADDPEDETLIERLERWARDREYDFSRKIRPEYVEGFRDAQRAVLGLIQAWGEDG